MLTAPEREALNWIDGRQAAMVETVQAWSEINTGSRNAAGLATMAAALDVAFASLGHFERLPAADADVVGSDGLLHPIGHGDTLRLTVRPEAPIKVLLAGHRDTVFAADHPFQHCRWMPDGRLNGPGVADMKGGLLVMLHALLALEASPIAGKIGYQVLINADEEVSSLGSAGHLADAGRWADLGLIYEPALPDGSLAGARKGNGNFVAVVRGTSAHAGRNPDEGRNAITALAAFVTAIAALHGTRPGLSLVPARIDGGIALNVVPDLAICRFNVRIAEHVDGHWLRTQIETIATQISDRHGVTLDLHGQFSRPPKPLDPATAMLLAAVRECGAALDLPISWKPTGGCCDGNNLAAVGLPVVDTLGVRGGAIHSGDEFLIPESLAERAKLSALLLMRLATGALPVPLRSPA
jgi:glutamate carboxypeptidase